MAPYLALLISELRVSMRERSVIFFNYLFPLVLFFLFGEMMNARVSLGGAQYILSTTLAMGIMGNGFFGIGMRAVMEREMGILRRLRMAPISAAPVLISSLVSGVLIYMPAALLTILLGKWVYSVPVPSNLLSVLAFVAIGNVAFRAIGLIIASVADSMAEASVLVQIFYIPMVFLSGATIPITNLPQWGQAIAKFMPATYLKSGLQSMLQNGESLAANITSVLALLATLAVGFFVSFKIFRWTKEDRISRSSKAWVTAILAPFLVVGVWESFGGTSDVRNAVIARRGARSNSFRLHDVRVFVGDGRVIDRADVFIRNGKIVEVVEDGQNSSENASSYNTIEGAGKTVLPGLIDAHAHFGASGITMSEGIDPEMVNWPEHAVRSYLYSGVVAAKSVGDATDELLKLKRRLADGEILGAELFMTGPLFTAPGGHGTEYFRNMPEPLRTTFESQMAAAYSVPADATARVDALAAQGVDGIKVVLESGGTGILFERLDLSVFDAVAAAARRHKLPVVVHTGVPQDIVDSIGRGAAGIEHGAMRDIIPDTLLQQLASKGVHYDPTLVVLDSLVRIARRDVSLIEDPVARQTIPSTLVVKMRNWIRTHDVDPGLLQIPELKNTAAMKNLINAHRAGVPLVVGTDSGNYGTFHGASLHREMELWQEAGIPAGDILKAATGNAAQLLGAGDRLGRIAAGFEASLLLVDGNPLEDIRGTRRISDVFFKGERVKRSTLFE